MLPSFAADLTQTVHVVPFFFYGYADHRSLHSFPTRRSSDLFLLHASCPSCGRHLLRKQCRWKTLNSCVFSKGDRKSTRLNSSHTVISYAVFCLKKKNDGSMPIPLYSIAHPDVLCYTSTSYMS